MLFVPSFMRSFIRPFLPPAICMKRLHARMRKILFPDTGIAEGKNNPTTLLQHFVDTSDPVIEEDIVAKLLVVIGAAVCNPGFNNSVRRRVLLRLASYNDNVYGTRCHRPMCVPCHRQRITRRDISTPPYVGICVASRAGQSLEGTRLLSKGVTTLQFTELSYVQIEISLSMRHTSSG